MSIVSDGELGYTSAMGDECVPPGLSSAEWSATPAGGQALLRGLLATVQQQAERTAALEKRAHKSSRNSEAAVNRSTRRPARPQWTPSGRKAGGQAGHGRALSPKQRCSGSLSARRRAVKSAGRCCWALIRQRCGTRSASCRAASRRSSSTDSTACPCLVCGHAHIAAWPLDMPSGSFGPRLQDTVGYLTGRLGVSQRGGGCGLPLDPGSESFCFWPPAALPAPSSCWAPPTPGWSAPTAGWPTTG
jgi:hypothetical protein